jgi:hypothetical protein
MLDSTLYLYRILNNTDRLKLKGGRHLITYDRDLAIRSMQSLSYGQRRLFV